MRTYGRVKDANGNLTVWVEVDTDADGFNDAVMLTTLIQCLKLNLNESPFYANYGIPAKPSVTQQLPPDFYVARTQQQFSGFFASLIVAKKNLPTPTYQVNVITERGVSSLIEIPA